MKKILSLLLVSSSIFSMQLDLVKTHKLQEKLSKCSRFNTSNINKVQIQPSSVFVPNRLGSIKLYHGKKEFSVRQNDKKYAIQKCFTDPMIRNITKEQLHAFLQAGYLSLNQMNDGEFSLKAKGRINGGGVWGAAIGAFLAKATVSIAGHGTIIIVSGLTGPAAKVIFLALESWLAAPIEAASIKAAVAGGIIGGVATGPV